MVVLGVMVLSVFVFCDLGWVRGGLQTVGLGFVGFGFWIVCSLWVSGVAILSWCGGHDLCF